MVVKVNKVSEIKKTYRKQLPIYYFPLLSRYTEIIHFVTSRHGGYSKDVFCSFNLAFHVGDEPKRVLKNRHKLAKILSIPLPAFTTSQQVHGTSIAEVTEQEKGKGAQDITTALQSTDAMITDQKGLCLLIFVADCVPIFLYHPPKKVVALVHAGCQGTLGMITQKTVKKLIMDWDCQPKDMIAAIGPSIGPCCYQVGPEIRSKIKRIYPKKPGLIHSVSLDGRGYFNLWKANLIQLLACQIPKKNIAMANLCTSCRNDDFYSHRKEQGKTGRFAAGVMIK